MSTHPEAPEVILHELGHSLGFLADEYGGPPPPACNAAFEPSEANATRARKRGQIKWNAWIDAGTPIPTPGFAPGVPGLYSGAKYCDDTLSRPTVNSKMRSLNAPFEQINTEQLIKRIYNFVSPLDSIEPPPSTIQLQGGQSQFFSASTLSPGGHALTTTWLVDNQPRATGLSLNLEATALGDGAHTVEFIVRDQTASVRNDPNHVLTASRKWTLLIGSPPQITGVTIDGKNLLVTGVRFQAGAVLEINGTAYGKTLNDEANPTTRLIGKKAGKQIGRGQTVTLTVLNPGNVRSLPFTYIRPSV